MSVVSMLIDQDRIGKAIRPGASPFARARVLKLNCILCVILAFALSRVCAVSRVFGRLGFKLPSAPIAQEVSSVFAGGRDPGSLPRSRTQGYSDLNNGSHGAISRL